MDEKHTARRSLISIAKHAFVGGFESLWESAARDLNIVRREGNLFVGAILATIGIFHFRSGKYCDGNSVDYLSCTRPSAFHYYGGLEIFLIVAGVFFILLWFLKKK
jgi:hypothetical protein